MSDVTAGLRYFCGSEQRRRAVHGRADLNGIDFLVVDANDQTRLTIHLLNPTPLPVSVHIEGGERVRNITATILQNGPVIKVRTSVAGDFSTYALVLKGEKLDPLLSRIDFSFKVNCPTDLDCAPAHPCAEEPGETPEIDYLARDYDALRRIMNDRIAVLSPEWSGPHPADMTTALVELMAYVGDRISYEQDAVSAEAYLSTARLRPSIRRHARLLDYCLHDGVNARVWTHFAVLGSPGSEVYLPSGKALLTCVGEDTVLTEEDYAHLLRDSPTVFETMHEAVLRPEWNEMAFHTWGDADCCLPAGATRATLLGDFGNLVGQVIIFEERRGAQTGRSEDADPMKRHAVRVTRATVVNDPLLAPQNTQVTEIEWSGADALPFPLRLSAPQFGTAPGAVILGNVVLADNGRTLDTGILLVPDTDPRLSYVRTSSGGVGGSCVNNGETPYPPRWRPRLPESPVAVAVAFDQVLLRQPASRAFQFVPADALPVIRLTDERGRTWLPRPDLLASGSGDTHFIVEMSDDRKATLRFGDDVHGRRPPPGTRFTPTYRVGGGAEGNIGADALRHIVGDFPAIDTVRNPIPARGGVALEPIQSAKQYAPYAYRTLERAVTAEDYAVLAQRHPEVQRAAATRRWTGSWYTVFLTVDRLGGLDVDAPFEHDLRRFMERYRLMGEDLEINGPTYVPVEIDLFICIRRDSYRADVQAELLRVLGSRLLSDGRSGRFHPDKWTFGQPVIRSVIITAAQNVSGVESVRIERFRRRGALRNAGERLEMGRLEIAQVTSSPNFPERGRVQLTVSGGR